MSQFSKFQNMPPELRYKIWCLARGRRWIIVLPHRLRPAQSLLRLPFHAPAPPLLHACRDSRRSMTAVYHKIFYDASSPSANGTGVAPYTWVDFSADVICVAEEHLPLLALGSYRHLIRHVEVVSRFLNDTMFYTSRQRCFRHGKALFELSRLQTALLVNEPTSVETTQRWPVVALGIMIDCYATCMPVRFDLRVVDRAKPGMVLAPANFRRWLAESKPVEISDMAELDIYSVSEEEVWTAWDTSDNPGWKHVDCECENITHRAQTFWNYRIKPTWEGGTHFTEFRGLHVQCTL
ncbi:hypothetical protein MY11210_002419 [Beauveria gryllotalpidicola]